MLINSNTVMNRIVLTHCVQSATLILHYFHHQAVFAQHVLRTHSLIIPNWVIANAMMVSMKIKK